MLRASNAGPRCVPYDLARALAAENAELRELLVAVAQELERLTASIWA